MYDEKCVRTIETDMDNVVLIGYVASFLSSIQFLPQVNQARRTHSIQGVSIFTIVIVIIAQICWIYYGINQRVPPVWLSATAILIMASYLLVVGITQNKNYEKAE